MLRQLVLLAAVALLLIGGGLCLNGILAPGAQLFGVGLLMVFGVLIERWRYRKEPRPDADWQPTGERFVDPATGKHVRVQYDPASGERRYLTEDDAGGPTRGA